MICQLTKCTGYCSTDTALSFNTFLSCCALVRSPSSGNLQPSCPVVSPPHSQSHTSLFLTSTSAALRISCFVHILRSLEPYSTRVPLDKQKVKVLKMLSSLLRLLGGVVSASQKAYSSILVPIVSSQAGVRLQRVLLEETSQTISNYGFQRHTRCSCCALLRWFYTIRPCAGALPLVNSFVPLNRSSPNYSLAGCNTIYA